MSCKPTLSFREEGSFRILMVSDLHGGVGYDKRTVKSLDLLVEKTMPDLVMLAGDTAGPGVIHISNAAELKEMLSELSSPMESRKIPWAQVFGNHDDNFGLSNAEAQKVYESFAHCISSAGPEAVSGVGNYVLPVYSADGRDILFAVYGLDSHHGIGDFITDCGLPADTRVILPRQGGMGEGDDGIHPDQVIWYWQESLALEKKVGHPVPGLMVMHEPIPEMALVAANPEECHLEGYVLEQENFDHTDPESHVPVSSPSLNSGLFRACLQRGDIRAIFTGHDHQNNFSGEYCGILLGYDGYLSYHACHDPRMFGGRVFDLSSSDPRRVTTAFIQGEQL